jgi:predicted RNA-binding Zn-ribbon protein involved in translation (DUF1610 family)
MEELLTPVVSLAEEVVKLTLAIIAIIGAVSLFSILLNKAFTQKGLSCPKCFEETIWSPSRSGKLLFKYFRKRWCISCGWKGWNHGPWEKAMSSSFYKPKKNPYWKRAPRKRDSKRNDDSDPGTSDTRRKPGQRPH